MSLRDIMFAASFKKVTLILQSHCLSDVLDTLIVFRFKTKTKKGSSTSEILLVLTVS